MRLSASLVPLVLLAPTCVTVAFVFPPTTRSSTTIRNTNDPPRQAKHRRSSTSATSLNLDGKGMAGGSQHLLGDVLRSLQPSYLSQVAQAVKGKSRGAATVDTSAMINNAPSWEELGTRLTRLQTPTEKKFRSDLERGNTSGQPPSALATIRLFDGDTAPRLTLYRDSAAWCPYCAKVWMTLEECRVSYEIKKIDMTCYGAGKPEEFLRVMPKGNLPVAVVGQDVFAESDDIVDLICEMSSSSSKKAVELRPKEGTEEAERFRELCDDGRDSLERRLYSRWMWWLTGVRRPAEYRQLYEEHLDEVEEALADAPQGGPYFLGRQLSLVDIRFAPFIERQVASLAYFKGYDARDGTRPNLERWLETLEARPSYQATKSDWYTHSRALPPQLSAGCSTEERCKELRDLIDELPAGPADASSATTTSRGSEEVWIEPGWGWCAGDMAAAKREAAERLIFNNENIVRFASRAAGTPGLPASAAPLADPRATPSATAEPAVDLFLRHAVDTLLSKGGPSGGIFGSVLQSSSTSGVPNDANIDAAIASLATGSAGGETLRAVADCLDYLRQRIGVPRDMSHPAAQALRAELKTLSGQLRSAALNGADAMIAQEEMA